MNVSAAELARIIKDSAIFASRDASLPMINAVRLESSAEHLVAIATDRFTLGVSMANYVDGEGATFGATLRLPQAQILAKVAESTKASFTEVAITATDTTVTFTFASGESVTLPSVGGMEFPAWRKLMVDREFTPTDALGLDPKLVARFARVKDAARQHMLVKFCGPSKPAVISIGSQFFGLVMPVRIDADAAKTPLPEWLTTAQTTAQKPQPKRARKAPAKKSVA
jgi:hypothetical protein